MECRRQHEEYLSNDPVECESVFMCFMSQTHRQSGRYRRSSSAKSHKKKDLGLLPEAEELAASALMKLRMYAVGGRVGEVVVSRGEFFILGG